MAFALNHVRGPHDAAGAKLVLTGFSSLVPDDELVVGNVVRMCWAVCHGVLFMDTSNYPLVLPANLQPLLSSTLNSLFLFLLIKVPTLAC